jgi:cobalt-zinc-cadmium efflux system membrane fusion protein
MKKQQAVLIPIILAIAAFGAWRILQTKVAPKADAHAHGGHEEDAGHEGHGHEEHGEEGHVELTAEALKNANLTIEEAAPATIRTSLAVYGKITANEEAIAHVVPRFPGLVKEVRKRLGDSVQKGDVLAVIESNESLRAYEVKSEIAGTVIAKDISLGEVVPGDKMIFVVADLSTVWVDLTIFRRDFASLKSGQPVVIHADNDAEPIPGAITYISPFGSESTQSALARAEISNPGGLLRPGLFVNARIITGETGAPVAVKNEALQTIEGKSVVFVQEGDAFEKREVETGAQDGERVEIRSGLLLGDKYVAGNSFILKADLGKSEAEHEH